MHMASVLVGRYDLPLFHQPHASTLKCTCPRLAFYTPELKLLSQMCKESNLQSLQDRIKCGKPIRAVQPNYDTLIKCGWFTTFYSLQAPFLAHLMTFQRIDVNISVLHVRDIDCMGRILDDIMLCKYSNVTLVIGLTARHPTLVKTLSAHSSILIRHAQGPLEIRFPH